MRKISIRFKKIIKKSFDRICDFNWKPLVIHIIIIFIIAILAYIFRNDIRAFIEELMWADHNCYIEN